MPTYDYHCEACGKTLEVFHSMTEAARKKCPECGKLELVRQIGAGGAVIFKGAGFYETDYRSDSYKQGQKADSASETPASSDSSSDSSSADSGSGKAEGSSEV